MIHNNETVLSPKSQTLAGIYARALFDITASRDKAQQLSDELFALSEIILAQPDFNKIAKSGAMKKAQRVSFVEKVFAGRVSKILENLLGVLAVNNRLNLIQGIAGEFAKLIENRAGKISVNVTLAKPATKAQLEELEKVLAKILKAQPVLITQIDPEIIGGIKLRVGDSIYDASIAGDLERLTEKMSHSQIFSLDSQK